VVILKALGRENIDEVIKLSEDYDSKLLLLHKSMEFLSNRC
jgi:hypothetical protein